jgi:hypothetical protein
MLIHPIGSESALLELLQEFLEHTPGLYDSVTTGATAFPVKEGQSMASL